MLATFGALPFGQLAAEQSTPTGTVGAMRGRTKAVPTMRARTSG